MADAVKDLETVEGLVSSTIKSLDKGIRYHEHVKEDNNLREAFHEAGRGLALVRNTFLAIQSNSARDSKKAMGQLKVCKTNADIAVGIFGTVFSQAAGTPRSKIYEQAVKQVGNGQPVEELVAKMMEDVRTLTDNFPIQHEVKELVKGLEEAIKKLSEMEPSVTKEQYGNKFTQSGSGDQFNAPNGTQNISKGNGHQFPGATFTGNLNF
ncbi:hypothetical protein KVR01_001195 [Diaporthe batatas]|uniref:uncharacterized protein n=1 Tax=Diaporthe batatas TaxID=748121 RepID=UPI001D050C24|nr:uncharacterized protein KVR01_001195 [Diaporthe batatas]KAG8168446.1 hypothetical protein KVR01_001195 [Diaporthe batatas]